MIKHIIREVAPEQTDLSFEFDNDGLTETSGDWSNNLFIISNDGWGRISGFNIETYKDVQRQAEEIIDGFANVAEGIVDYDGKKVTYKTVMEEVGIPYSSRKCHALKGWTNGADINNTDDIAAFLTIRTGKEWKSESAHGYNQGDYVEMVYCVEKYREGVKRYGEIWLGAAKEFCAVDVDENGEETDCYYGYIVADCEAQNDEDYKRIICEWNGFELAETQLEMIESSYTETHYKYRTA